MANGSFNVLIVDDNEMNRDTLARRLRQQGFSSKMAVDGREALTVIRDEKFDLVLLDIMMPEVDGYEVLQTIKSDEGLRNIPVIMISAMEEIESVMKCMEMGAEDYLTKPFDPVLLQAAIARCLKKAPAAESLPPVPAPPPIMPLPPQTSGQRTVLQTTTTLTQRTPAPTTNLPNVDVMPLDEVIGRIVNSSKVSRKGYRHLSNSLFHTLFNNRRLSEHEFSQLNLLFNLIQVGQIKIVD
ncbi:MAG: response regulator [Oscillatoriales cyanobacterium SM2_1_8]|nr:response regulator [Oscillatoriales cyanobacterium SM2_1_8]